MRKSSLLETALRTAVFWSSDNQSWKKLRGGPEKWVAVDGSTITRARLGLTICSFRKAFTAFDCRLFATSASVRLVVNSPASGIGASLLRNRLPCLATSTLRPRMLIKLPIETLEASAFALTARGVSSSQSRLSGGRSTRVKSQWSGFQIHRSTSVRWPLARYDCGFCRVRCSNSL